TLLITGGVAGAAAVLINSTNASKEADTQTIFTKTNIEFLIKSLQDGIDQYKLTRTKFSDQNYVDFVKNSLYSKDKKAGHLITNVEYLVSGSNEEILISLNKKFEYSLDGIVPADNLATYDSKAKTITLNVSTLEFYKAFEIQNLGGLYDLFNDKVLEPNNLYTSSEFLSYINNNNAIAKSEITNFLKVNVSSRSADTLEIDTLVFEENLNKLEITLKDNGRIDYTTTINSPNVTLNNNIITVSNFTFYTAYQLQKNKIDTFKEAVQNYINSATNQYTLDEFNDQLDSQAFKTEIAAHFSIPESAINRIEFNNDILKITPPAMTKYVNEANKIISDIQVTKLNFYTAQDLINLDTLYNAIKNYILDSTRKYTLNEFDSEVENNSNAIKTLISQNLYIAENQNISLADILSVDFNDATKKLEITLQNNYKKYNLTPAYNVDLIDNKLIISNLTFYEGIQIEPTKLDNFQNNIQGFINDLANQYTLTEFTDQIASTSFKALISSSLGIPLSSINEIKFEKSTLTITTNDMKKFVSTSTSNVLSNGELVVTGLQFYTSQSLVKLDGLYSAINNYIINPARKFTVTEFTDAANNISNATIKDLVAENLYISETEKIDANEIDTVNFNEATQELEISLNVTYKKYSLEPNNKVEWKNGKLIVKNFTFYTAIQIEEQKLNDLQSFIQDYINSSSNQFTQNEFTNQINSEDFTNQIATHLGINKLSINNISFTNNSLFINPLTLQKFTTTAQNNSLVAGSIVVNNFQFFTEQSLVRLDSLYSALNSYIVASNRKYTAQEFSTQITNNNDEIKNIVLNNLYISQTETIDPDKVSKVSFNAENQLEITFTNDYIKYQFAENDNFELDGYKLLVKNLTFYTAANITNDNLNNLGTKIQEYINKPENQFLLSEFQSQIDSRNFKKVIADALSISSDAIGNVIYSSDTLKIQPANLYKFVPDQQSSLIVGNNIQIQNLMFYTGKTFINLQNLYNAVNNYIIDSSRKFTAKEFKNDITTHMSDLKTLVIRNLQTSNAGAVAVDEIDDISLNADNNFVITLNDKSGNYFKYSVQTNSNVVLEDGNKLVIKNLTYYTDLTISDDDLQELWNSVNTFIEENAITVGTDGNISGYLNYRIFDLFKAVKTVENQSLGE
ncbi:MAG: hypothetical protein K2K73_01480, partial [Ureaplasma sp.]|nr:hypothetical protein [Ureaplasma sp.]